MKRKTCMESALMISAPIRNASWIASAVFPVAVGPVTTMTGGASDTGGA
jgi:hypothetical protein